MRRDVMIPRAAPNETDRLEIESSEKGYSLVHWVGAGMNSWAISDANGYAL